MWTEDNLSNYRGLVVVKAEKKWKESEERRVESELDQEAYRNPNWKGGFNDYVALVTRNPLLTRSAFQRICDISR